MSAAQPTWHVATLPLLAYRRTGEHNPRRTLHTKRAPGKHACGAAGAVRAAGRTPAARRRSRGTPSPPTSRRPAPLQPPPSAPHAPPIEPARSRRRRRRCRCRRPSARRQSRQSCQSRHPRPAHERHSGVTRNSPLDSRSDRSSHRGRPSADLARGARDVAGELGWRRARLRRGGRGRGRLSSLREHRQKRARGAGEAERGIRVAVRMRARRAGGRVRRARARRPGAREARVVDP